jgi:hypothetical protein
MAGIERLTDLAAPIASLEPRVDGTPLRGLGWLEVAAAMAKLPRAGADLLRCLYLDDRHALARTLKRLVVRLSGSPGLSVSLQHAVAAATLQAFMAMRPCRACGGHGFIHIAESEEMDECGVWTTVPAVNEQCAACDGQGIDHLDVAAVCALLEVGEQTWEMLLREPFQNGYRELRHLHDQASAILTRRLR